MAGCIEAPRADTDGLEPGETDLCAEHLEELRRRRTSAIRPWGQTVGGRFR